MKDYNKLFINNQWVKAQSGNTFESINPADGSKIADVAAAGAPEVEAAVKAARQAFEHGEWSRFSGSQRAEVLRKIANGIRNRLPELAKLEVLDNGKPLPEAEWDLNDAAGCFDFYADLAEKLDNECERNVIVGDARFSSVARKEPVGVAAAIIPWNYPLLMASWKVAPALAAGCTMILKPAEATSLTAVELGDIALEAGLPAGVLNILTGSGREIGAMLSAHPDIDKIAFTGSVPVGQHIMQSAAANVKNISLELGGKSAFIVFDDSDIEAAVEWIMFGIFWNQGQVCSATSRLLVQNGIHDKLMARLAEEAQKITIGNGLEKGVLLGPLVNEKQYQNVMAAIERGRKDGVNLLTGGKRPDGFDKGFFVEPTVFTDVPLDHPLWTEEIFGPVLAVRRFETEDEAIELANNSEFGLGGAVMSEDLARCDRVARRLRAGIIWINCSQPTFTEAPWGGYKQSGIGRELGEWGLENYLETKQITRYDSKDAWAWYLK